MRRLWLLPFALAAGCAAAHRGESSPTREPDGSVDDYAARIERLERELSAHVGGARPGPTGLELDAEAAPQPSEPVTHEGLAAASPPDCRAAFDLRDRICDLAGRICAIAERDRGDRALAATCDNARASCTRATADVAQGCGE